MVRKGISTTAGVILLIIMLIAFYVIRELWQKGGKPLGAQPWYVHAAIAVIGGIVLLVIAYYIHKKYA
ncbi:MAG: hypothetical protein QXF09_01325 [Nitrososphaerota archaeon]